MQRVWIRTLLALALAGYFCVSGALLTAMSPQGPPVAGGEPAAAPTVPADYVIGVEDVLSIVFWKDKEMSADVVVRPDGKISLPLLNDVQAAGYTPEQLSQALVAASSKYIEQATVTVIVKEINSRKVFILGQVGKPGAFPLIGTMNVLQLIALAGGVLEYADSKNITVVRKVEGEERRFKFNYKDVIRGRNEQQNIRLLPGDTVVVP
jgi:polysaccharide export outer membrane protein